MYSKPEAGFIRGISIVDPDFQVAISDYRPSLNEGEEGVHVVEMWNGPAAHLANKVVVFGRYITEQEHERRIQRHTDDAVAYYAEHRESLAK